MPIIRKYKTTSFTLNKTQVEYITQRCKDGYSRSRWVREAVDARIAIELEELRRCVRRGIIKKTGNYDRAAISAIRDSVSADEEAMGDIRTSIQKELSKFIGDSFGELPLPKDSKS